jgi:Protein of unknown function (DUF3365)
MAGKLSRGGPLAAGALGLAVALAALLRPAPATTAEEPKPDRAAVERARQTVNMLDDLYKGYVVHVTNTYVKAQEHTAAARVTKKVFKHMEDKGWHKARLVDATGEPAGPQNEPKTAFEKKAVGKLKGGETYFDEVGTADGKPVLRAATAVPVVMKACIGCHPGRKEGDLLGAIVYELPIK